MRKYSLKEGNLTLARLDERTDDGRECSSERDREDTTIFSNVSVEIAVVSEKENSEKDKQTQRIEEEEVDDYFQDPTDICK